MSLAERARQIFEVELKNRLEAGHDGQFVAIEPESREWFLAATFVDAALSAKSRHPDRKSFVIRIGHEAAFHIGAARS